jgi:GAF domain-containing protein
MGLSATLPTAVAAIVLGAGLLGLLLLSLRWFAVQWPRAHVPSPVTLPLEPETAAAGVLVAQAGGRVVFANARARELFDLDGQEPNLWRMAQQAQPTDAFLELFVAEGRASLSISERQVEATSLHMPADGSGPERIVVMLREIGQLPDLAVADERTVQAVSVISEVSQAISASLDLEETLDAILSSVGRAFQYHIAEITLWDEAAQALRPARYAGDRSYERELAQGGAPGYAPGEGYSGWIAAHRQPLLVRDVETFTAARPKLDNANFPFRSYVGVPLLLGSQLVGTLELVSYKPEAYRQSDLLLLNAIAGQAAIAIQNAQLFAEQERRVAELSGLADLARAIEYTADRRELYGRLTADIARLMGVQMVGFLIYDAAENALVGQPPFFGVPDIVVEIYRIPLAPGSAAERLWRESQPWLSNDVPADALVDQLGLRQLAETAGVKASMLAPITIGNRRLGVLQVSNKRSGAAFSDRDARLLSIFAGQAAVILDNARLVGEARERAEREEGLRQLTAAAAASTELDTILHTAMEQTAALLRFDVGVIALLDEARGELAPHPASIFGGSPQDAEAARLRTDDPLFAFSVTRSRRPFLSNHVQRDRRLSGIYRAVVERLGMGSTMDVPLVVGDRGIGEMIVGARRENAFTQTELQLLATVASGLASAIERARLYAATDQNLQQRVEQLTALTRVGRELNQTLDLERILRLVHDEALHATRADCGTILLLDPNAAPGVVALRLGEEALGSLLTPLELEAVSGERPRRVADLAPGSPHAAHAEVRAAMVMPIIVQGAVAGLIHLHSRRPEGFDDSAAEIASALAAQTAVAVGNAQRYEEQIKRGELLRRRADQLAQLFRISRTVRSDQPLAANLEAIAFGLQEAVGYNAVLISVLDSHTRRLKRTASARDLRADAAGRTAVGAVRPGPARGVSHQPVVFPAARDGGRDHGGDRHRFAGQPAPGQPAPERLAPGRPADRPAVRLAQGAVGRARGGRPARRPAPRPGHHRDHRNLRQPGRARHRERPALSGRRAPRGAAARAAPRGRARRLRHRPHAGLADCRGFAAGRDGRGPVFGRAARGRTLRRPRPGGQPAPGDRRRLAVHRRRSRRRRARFHSFRPRAGPQHEGGRLDAGCGGDRHRGLVVHQRAHPEPGAAGRRAVRGRAAHALPLRRRRPGALHHPRQPAGERVRKRASAGRHPPARGAADGAGRGLTGHHRHPAHRGRGAGRARPQWPAARDPVRQPDGLAARGRAAACGGGAGL